MSRTISPTEEEQRAEEVSARLRELLDRLQAEAPRTGLGAPTGTFVDHIAELAQRYGAHLFVCFDHPLIPPTSNGLERFFGASKAQTRRALAAASTANGVVQNLGADYLVAFATTWTSPPSHLIESTGRVTREQFIQAHRATEEAEAPARLRRSRRRRPDRHLEKLHAAWEKSKEQPS